jgi:hypothetical protein
MVDALDIGTKARTYGLRFALGTVFSESSLDSLILWHVFLHVRLHGQTLGQKISPLLP